jgi:ferritin-like metal-binding protein YciE
MKKNEQKMMLHDIFVQKLQSLLDVEQTLVKALPKMAKAASNPELKKGFNEHLVETKGQVERLKEVFASIGEKPKALKGDAIRGIVKDGEWIIKNVKGKTALDANLIAAASYVEHYEMAGYTAALAWAKEMKHKDTERLLKETLAEEEKADTKMAALGKSIVFPEANTL